jgi:hypothetical protein
MLERLPHAGAHTWPALVAFVGGGLVIEWWRILLPVDLWTKARTPGNNNRLAKLWSGATPEEADFTDEWWHSGEVVSEAPNKVLHIDLEMRKARPRRKRDGGHSVG